MNKKIEKNNLSIGFIGGGRITRIMLTGWKRKGELPGEILVSDANFAVLQDIKRSFPEVETFSDNAKAAACDIVFLALHPPVVGNTLDEIKTSLKPSTVFVSLAPKLTIASLALGLGGFDRIVRIIPNAPSVINEGYNPVVFSSSISKDERKYLKNIFKTLGEFPEVAEEKLEAYAIITAMGPTYFWFQLQELKKMGESFGLSAGELDKAIYEMVKGTGKTLCQSGMTYEEVNNLIPVKPLGEEEQNVRNMYQTRLNGLYQKLKG